MRKRRHVGSLGRLEGDFKICVRSNRIRFAQCRDQRGVLVIKELDRGFF